MIELKLLPDGMTQVPQEATDHGVLWDLIQSNSTQEQRDAFINNSPADSIRDIERVVSGNGDYIAIRVPGEPADYPDDLLDATAKFITDNIPNLKAHPQGWQSIADERR